MPTTSGRTPSGGPTSADNGQGLCADCNHTKELPGWAATRETSPPGPDFAHPDSTAAGSPHTVRVATAPGHAYYLTPPPLLDTLVPPGRARPSGAETSHDAEDADNAEDSECLLEAAFHEWLEQVAYVEPRARPSRPSRSSDSCRP